MIATVCRKEHFSGAHRIFRADWSKEKNWTVFGKCSHEHYHGHNYVLVVKITGKVDRETGYVYDMAKLSTLIHEHVISLLDHKNFNKDIPHFETTIPTTEHLAGFIYERLRPHIAASYALSIVLHETEKNAVEYSAS